MTKHLDVSSLSVMHAGYRLGKSAMRALMNDVQNGVVFASSELRNLREPQNGIIAITRFEDGCLAIRDGLHRATAIMLMRPSGALHPQEFVIEEMTYDDFLRPNLAACFFTPFDPRIQVRIADWDDFRREVLRRIAERDDALAYIESNRHIYTRPREDYHQSLSTFFRHMQQNGEALS